MAQDTTQAEPGRLYVCATPLGNLGDVSHRLLQVLTECATIVAEDTRITRKLLSHYGIRTRLVSCHEHTHPQKIAALVERLRAGETLALVCNAGTPVISDPGAPLIAAAVEAGVAVVPIPGPSAVVAALSVAGLPARRFWFEGFLPRRGKERAEAVRRLATIRKGALVLYESPNRLAATLSELSAALGDRQAAVCRELTKLFEEVRRGSLGELAAWAAETERRGELTVVIGPTVDDLPPPTEDELRQRLGQLVEEGLSQRDAVRQVVAETGAARNAVYAIATATAAGK